MDIGAVIHIGSSLFPPASAVHLIKVTVVQDSVRLQLTATDPTASCPCCAVHPSPVDISWGARLVPIQLTVRKFVCRHPSCERRIFTECLLDLVVAYALHTPRLVTALRAIGVALAGAAGARLAARLRRPASPTTLLRLVRAAPILHIPALQVIGLGEWT